MPKKCSIGVAVSECLSALNRVTISFAAAITLDDEVNDWSSDQYYYVLHMVGWAFIDGKCPKDLALLKLKGLYATLDG